MLFDVAMLVLWLIVFFIMFIVAYWVTLALIWLTMWVSKHSVMLRQCSVCKCWLWPKDGRGKWEVTYTYCPSCEVDRWEKYYMDECA